MQNENYIGTSPDKEEDQDRELEQSACAGDGEAKMALTDEDVKVKFTSNSIEGNRNGEAKIDIEQLQMPYAGMTKEELLKFANDPFWVRLRWTLFILFWLIWLMMLVGAIVIIVLAERCAPEPTADWWQKSAIYQIYPWSFKDSDGDGIGDLKGIESKLDYLDNELGVKTVLINSIYESKVDYGYDITNFTNVNSTLGGLAAFHSLVEQLQKRDMKLVLDFVPNHSSKDHPWFEKSRRREAGYEDYYIWKDGNSGNPPNEKTSVYGGSAWKFDDIRGQYYYFDFLDVQPALNLRNPAVQEELEAILKFWRDNGADGFRVDSVKYLIKDDSDILNGNHQTEVLELLSKWKHVINNRSDDDHHRILLSDSNEGTDIINVINYYGTEDNRIADISLNYQLLGIKNSTLGVKVQELVQEWVYGLAEKKWAWSNWLLGNHDNRRVASRVHPELADGMNMINLLVGGTPLTYYGEEIGMTDGAELGVSLDPRANKPAKLPSRDPQRTPMQWDNSSNAGFSDKTPWLTVNSNYLSLNVEAEKADKRSHLNVYKKLMKLREQPAILFGKPDFPRQGFNISPNIFAFFRVKKGTPGFLVVVNFGNQTEQVNVDGAIESSDYSLSEEGTIEVCSANVPNGAPLRCDTPKAKVPLAAIPLGPYQAVVLKFVPSFA